MTAMKKDNGKELESELEAARCSFANRKNDHAGLLLDKYLAKHDDPASKDKLIDAAKAAAKKSLDSRYYQQGLARWSESLKSLYQPPAHFNEFSVVSKDRLLIGAGAASPLEVGLSLHHTYGLPYLPATALKGLASHYAHSVWGEKDARWRMATQEHAQGEYHRFVFGSTVMAACIDFHDGLLLPRNGQILVEDVMTPHHSSYYGAGEEDNDHPPTDWESPIPIQYLTANKDLEFHLFLGCTLHAGSEQQHIGEWLDITKALVIAALGEWGLGAKTSSGYGVMT